MKCYTINLVPKNGLVPFFGVPRKIGVVLAESEEDGLKKLGFKKIIKDEHSNTLGGQRKEGIIYLEKIEMMSSLEELDSHLS